jgi:hypothetical protein
MDSALVASDENVRQNPNIELANKIYRAEQKMKKGHNFEELKCSILEEIKNDNMVNLYVQLCDSFKWGKDDSIVATMEATNSQKLLELENSIKDATENAGDTEVRCNSRLKYVTYV